MRPSAPVDSSSVPLRIVRSLGPLVVLLLLAGCSGDDDEGDGDAGPAECPTGAPDVGTACNPAVGQCPYEGLNRDCPPFVGNCRCVQGGWVCDVPECTTCNETCNGDCCNEDDVCRAGEGGLAQACGPEGDHSAAMFEECGHESDCAGTRNPICSPICDDGLCCTNVCEGQDDCDEGTCANGVCSPEAV